MLIPVSDNHWLRLAELIAERTGLSFGPDRRADLQRGVAAAAREMGFDDVGACVSVMLDGSPTAPQMETLANHLTVGETYFLRDRQLFELFAREILPQLVRSRRGRDQRLRLWSAACATGEEPYSLAIALQQGIPDLCDWQVTITATDINSGFLQRAAAGIYGEWSFRDTPAGFRERHFRPIERGRRSILPVYRRLVSFSRLNLAEDVYPSVATNTNAMDVIFCRNALIYFTPAQTRKVISGFHRSLVEGGWLVVAPSEASHALFSDFTTVNFPGVILYRKSGGKPLSEKPAASAYVADSADDSWPSTGTIASSPDAVGESPSNPVSPACSPECFAPAQPLAARRERAEALYRLGHYSEAADTLISSISRDSADPQACSLLARALANEGRLADALAWCDVWVDADKLNPAAHYLRAVVLMERGDTDSARLALQRALYLKPGLVLAHFALGNLDRQRGRLADARKSYMNALDLLSRHEAGQVLADSDGLTAGRLAETIALLTGSEAAA